MEKTVNAVEIVRFNQNNSGEFLPGTYRIEVFNNKCNNINPCNKPIPFQVQVLVSSYNSSSVYNNKEHNPRNSSNIWKYYHGTTSGMPDQEKPAFVTTIDLLQ